MSDPYVSDGDEDDVRLEDITVELTEADGIESHEVEVVAEVDAEDDSIAGVDGDVMVLEEVDDALVLPMWEPTGEEQVDEALELLSTLDVDDVHQHAAVFSDIHERLRDTLSTADDSSD
jgi:hypothetical protein